MKQLWQRVCGRFGKDRSMRWMIGLGIVGILLIALTEWLPHKEANPATVTATESQVEQALERRITTLLRQVEGVGDCRVMVTLDSGARMEYAVDRTASMGADGSSSLSEGYLSVDTDEGPMGLPLTTIAPTIRGVAVVCDGGGDATVCHRVVQVVATAFHISERRVCVVKQK